MQIMLSAKNTILLAALAAAFPAVSQAAAAARVDFAVGVVTAVAANGAQRSLGKGGEVAAGETIHTGDDGRAQLRFSDGAMVSLQPRTDFRIDEYRYSGQNDGQEKGFFSLLRGGLRTITGWVGKGNRDNYRVTTQVATIGIRGTGYSVAYTDAANEAIVVHTGEGKIEVCNSAGCVDVSGGESAIVEGGKARPKLTAEPPRLPPARPVELLRVDYAVGENRADTGGVPFAAPAPVIPLVSGSGYAVSRVGMVSGTLQPPETATGAAAVFSSVSELQSFQFSVPPMAYSFQASSIADASSADGVIGWGRWVSGTESVSYRGLPGGNVPLDNYHYVVGMPTASADIDGLRTSNFSATYQLIGATLPTSETGVVGQAPSGSLTAGFNSGGYTVNVAMQVPIAGTTYSVSGTGGPSGGGSDPHFVSTGGTLIYDGFFAGSNASHAGLTYKFDSANPSLGYVMGAAAFKR